MNFDKPTIVFGTGYIASKLIFWENQLNIAYFIDNNAKAPGMFFGYSVKEPKEILESEFGYVILATVKYMDEMRAQLLNMGISGENIVDFEELNLFDIDECSNDNKEDYGQILNAKIRTQKEFDALKYDDELLEMEMSIKSMVLNSSKKRIYYPARCQVCNRKTNLLIDDRYDPNSWKVNFRERMVCPFCEMNNRQRVMAKLVMDTIPYKSTVYMAEQVTSMYRVLKEKYENLIGSEYYGKEFKPGEVNNAGIRNEDLSELSFKDETIDCVVTNDCFEHVADIKKVLSEIYRVLKKDGVLYSTFPMCFNNDKTVRRACINDGKIEFLHEPIYHGNPISKDGSLVFFDYGWDLVELVRTTGFRDAYFAPFYSAKCGNIGAFQRQLFIFVALK